jgi:cytidylate kinase
MLSYERLTMLNLSTATPDRRAGPRELPAITVSGFLGSSARRIAVGVALELGIGYIDRQILVDAARELGVTVDAFEYRVERARSIGERVASLLSTLMETVAATDICYPLATGGLESALGPYYAEAGAGSLGRPGRLNDQRYLATLTSVIKGVAARGNVVVVGHGSEAILQHQPHTLRVFVSAPRDYRVVELMRRGAIPERDAQQRIHADDQHRCAFNRQFFNVGFDDPALYDLIVQADQISFDRAVQLVSVAARTRAPRAG